MDRVWNTSLWNGDVMAIDTELDSAILQVVAEHHRVVGDTPTVGESYPFAVQIHSAIRGRWSWMTDAEEAREVIDKAHDLAEGGLLEEMPPRSGLDPFFDYRMTQAGQTYLRDNPPPHECRPPQGIVIDPPEEWTCPDCGAVFRPRVRYDQIIFHEPTGESRPATWVKMSDGAR